ncbi:MAG: hypothetical protein H2058_12080 [Muricauda sp.]|nr:hypothetical protein [Allomuricauda sp.]MBA4745983.1 hypothetical protein [Allomuricauda sp.]
MKGISGLGKVDAKQVSHALSDPSPLWASTSIEYTNAPYFSIRFSS